MSYDVSIWCARPFRDPGLLPSAEKWTTQEQYWSFDGGRWILNTGPSVRAEEEDIPDEILGTLPGIEHVVYASLEPIGAPKTGHAMLRKLARTVARQAHGVILDPQADTIELPRGVKRFVAAGRGKEERLALLRMSWWFTHARVLEADWIDAFLALLEKLFPESMPRRYGTFEPPQHKYAETGREHLAEFLRESLTDFVVWYAERPAVSWSFSVKRDCGWQRLGPKMQFRCNRASVDLDAAALDQAGWQTALRRFWREASRLFDPFFGDVRTLRGYTGRLPHIGVDGETEQHPTASWWWKGIPPKLGHAAVVGAPYLAHWRELQTTAEHRDGLLFLATDDWTSHEDASDLVVGVPEAIALPFMPHWEASEFGGRQVRYPDSYPEVFPFGEKPRT
jgi:hypothetical protein